MNKYYKETFSAFQPSDEAVERVFEMTTDKKKINFNSVLKRIGAAALALAVFVCSGVGINTIVSKNSDSELGIMIACAGERQMLKAESFNEQKLFYRIYVSDSENEQEVFDVKNEWGNEKAQQLELAGNFDEGISGCVKSSESGCFNDKNKLTANIYTLSAGLFSLNLDDYTNVESMTVENSSKYGQLNLCIAVDSDELMTTKTGHQISVKSDALNFSVESGLFSFGTGKGEVNRGYDLYWGISDDLKNAVGNNVDFDFSAIKDTITFTVKYLDGSFEKASIDLEFDKDGYMHIVTD